MTAPNRNSEEDDDSVVARIEERGRLAETESVRDWYDEADDGVQAVVDRIFDEFPELVAIAWSGPPHPVRLLCPSRGHRVLTVTVEITHHDRLNLTPMLIDGLEAGRIVAEPSDPLHSHGPATTPDSLGFEQDYDAVERLRVTLRCPKKGCGYMGVHRQERLLKLYAVAVRLGLGEIRLPA